MKIIQTDEQLRCHLPNVIASVKGETPLIEKLSVFLDLAEEWFSPELMSALRRENLQLADRKGGNLRGDLTGKRSEIVSQIKAQIVAYLRDGSFNARRLADIVNVIRSNEPDFKEWHGSDVAGQFSPPVFRNQKKASGYFF